MKKEKKGRIDFVVGIVILLVVLLVSMGCSPCERLARKCPPVESSKTMVRDTTIITVTIDHILQTVPLPPERVTDVSMIGDTATAETAFAMARSYVEEDRIILDLINKDSAEVLVARVHELEQRLSEKNTETVKVLPEYRTRPLTAVLAWVGAASLLLAVVSVVYRINVGRK